MASMMDLLQQLEDLSPVAAMALALTTSYFIYLLTITLRRRVADKAIKARTGAQDAPAVARWPLLWGIDTLHENIGTIQAKRVLSTELAMFRDMGSNTWSTMVLGTTFINTTEPENLKAMMATDFRKWGLGWQRKKVFRPLLGEGIFTTDGAAWSHSREMLRPNFTKTQVGDLASFERHVQDLFAVLPKDGTTVDLSPLFFRLTLDSATEFLLGEGTHSLATNGDDGFSKAMDDAQAWIAALSFWKVLSKFFPWTTADRRQFKQNCEFVHRFVDGYVEKGLAKRQQLLEGKDSKTRYTFIDELVRQTDDRVRIRSEILNILLAGRDTTASLLTNVWWVLSKRPDIWTKLQDEIARLDGAQPTFDQLKELRYLRALLNESLRMHPVVPQNSREAEEATTLPLGGGPDGKSPLFIGKGQIVAWTTYAMHRRHDLFGEDAEEFKPERWLDDPATGKKGLRAGWEYLPFNGGARICLGQQYALTEASYVCVRLCQAFSGIESRDEREEWVEGFTITCVSDSGAKVGLTPRV